MAKGDIKADPRAVIRAHRATYVNAHTGRRRPADHLVMEAVPVVVGGVSLAVGVRLATGIAVALLTVAGLLSAFLFGALLQISDRAMTWADSQPAPGPATSAHATFLRELAANSGYGFLVSLAAAIDFGIASSVGGWPLRALSAVGLGLGCHLALTLTMVVKRVFALTNEGLTAARTGTGRRRAS